VRKNVVKSTLESGGAVFGVAVFEFATSGLARILSGTGSDFVFFDQEHTGWTVQKLRPLIADAIAHGLVPIVRPPAKEPHMIGAALDAGAMGLMISTVESAQEARAIVTAAKYPPRGRRGFGLVYSDQVVDGAAKAMEEANGQQVLIALIESAPGLKNVEEIAAVDGIDVLWIGHNDLSVSMGIPGQFESDEYRAAVDRILAAATNSGKAAGVTAGSVNEGRVLLSQGFRCLELFDIGMFETAVRDSLSALRREVDPEGAVAHARI
jgi:2-dehydro-3-deoxyglucarate aldolase/4-hydroxy-2-oxoheptanedioate aldolase